MTVCEFLHCTYSELDERCKSMGDIAMILYYIKAKNEKEQYAIDKGRR